MSTCRTRSPRCWASRPTSRSPSSTSYAPAEFLAEDGKTPVGYDVDLSNALAKVLGLKADQQVSKFDLIIPAVGSKYDVGISSFTITPERMDAVDFVSFYKAGSTWVTKKGNPTNVDTTPRTCAACAWRCRPAPRRKRKSRR